ncbi:hypothetical protein DXD68_13120 [Parabacteroides sp. TM07-1AC]|uniref:hypothetical protein n=1 Tax=Parabacteroides sp. TM07-1AC TaxID=2292363 RepID=UPI000EFF58F1|nr:hypothetical protein [Parabacteroides sp. TM07-1AC]RHU26288.1 hypothetical protein DXD68_13120 [Parabacteroides sp. TM07-1AC]
MKTKLFFLLCIFILSSAGINTSARDLSPEKHPDSSSKTLKRSESFLGFHFDFHAGMDCNEIGKRLTEEMIDSLLLLTKPDYIQVDCKGHAGYSSYPTQVGNQAPGFEKDILDIFRKVTRKHNVALYVHYSGIWDTRAMQIHPEWGIVHQDGTYDQDKAAYFGPYSDKLLIPQLKEIAAKGIDGAWIDGDCWSAIPDYSLYMQQFYTKETGKKIMPKNGEEGYPEFLELNRKAFRLYMKKYMDAIHEAYPGFQITSNWSYSSMMPEKIDTPVDFLSGDVAGKNGVYSAAWEARCLALQGKPWDLMSWGFNFNQTLPSNKSLVMLQQEAAEVIAMGGGFQTYYQQNRDGSLKTIYFDQMKELAAWCRARQAYCHHSKAIPQIALWYSTHAWKKAQKSLYTSGESKRMAETLNMLLDGRQTVEVLMDHYLKDHITDYSLVVLPEWSDVGAEMKEIVLNYVKNGGNLLITGVDASLAFSNETDVRPEEFTQNGHVFLFADGQKAALNTRWQKVIPGNQTKTFGIMKTCDDPYYNQEETYPMATISPYGRGKIAAIYCDLSDPYQQNRSANMAQIFNSLVTTLHSKPLATISGNGRMHLVLNQKKNDWIVNIINIDGEHNNSQVSVYDSVLPTGPVELTINTDKNIKKATLQPEGKKLSVKEANGKYVISVPPVRIHSIIQLSF